MTRRFNAYDLPLAVFLLSAVIGIFPGYDPSLSVKTLAVLLVCGVLYALLSRMANSRVRWDAAALGLATVTAVVSVYYVMLVRFMGGGENVAPIANSSGRIAGLLSGMAFWKPLGNTISTFVEGGLFLLVGLAVVERRSAPRALLVTGLVFAVLALLLSDSHGAWLAIFCAGLLWAALYWKPARWITLAVAIGLVGILLFIMNGGDTSVFGNIPLAGGLLSELFDRPDRLEVYRNSLALIRDVPFTGIGLGGQFAFVYARYELLLHVPYLYYAHNLFLEIWLEQGLLGIFAWVWLVVSIIAAAFDRQAFDDPGTRIRFEATWIGLIAVLIHGVTDARHAQAQLTWLPFFVLLGLNAALRFGAAAQPGARKSWIHYLPVGAGIGFLLLALVSVGSLPAALRVNRAALLQHRADLATQLDQPRRDVLLDRSAALFESVLKIDPENTPANQRLGLIALSRHEFAQAILYLRAANEADPRHPGTRRALGLSLVFAGSFEEAAPFLHGQLNILDELNHWGAYYLASDRTEPGMNAYRMSFMLDPDQKSIPERVKEALAGKP